ncbi:centriole, cilia and spindle-associated protein isoform X2 [Cololabis saira]|uniref:centriole, cilia and spindle-associated protein isoform X2 n=1 Tax=Cololabis saira TaxID=129043 RepID=UPI002AD313E9|nr:centriole, cilia and spindle-associated protein isoform X2 [Cololabis saira]
MVTKKVRTEYMKKFRDPKWETFSKCYEDSVKYRLTRRVMEHSHKSWFWEGWDGGSDSSGWSTPRLTRNKVAPLSLPPPPGSSEVKQRLSQMKTSPSPKSPSEDKETEVAAAEAPVVDAEEAAAVVENGGSVASAGSVTAAAPNSGPSDDTGTEDGPADSVSSDGEPPNPPNPAPRRRHRRRTPRSEPEHPDSSHDDKPAVTQKPPRAKSQPPVSSREIRRTSSRLDCTDRKMEGSQTFDASVQTRRESDKRNPNLDRRRARSADLEKMKQLTVVDDRWMTEYMRCFSARIR